MGNVWVFDADDTLWQNEWMYSKATADFISFLYQELGRYMPNLHDLKDRLFAIDKENFTSWGIRRGRVADTMIKTYEDVCSWIKWRFGVDIHSEAHLERIRVIGDTPFDHGELVWNDDVREVLHALNQDGDTTCLLSSYDKQEFPKRIKLLGIDRFFSPEHILLTEVKKTPDDFARVSGWTPKSKSRYFVVGNGLSDIEPALELGDNWQGIYIPHATTSVYHTERGNVRHFTPPASDNPRITTLHSISNLKDEIDYGTYLNR